MEKILKLGTRDSPLAMWQAEKVQHLLREKDIKSEIIAVKSEGDLDLVTPLYAMGVQGVFTKTLDAHLLSGYIDIAVHSMKDVPVQMAEGLKCSAVLKRATPHDVLVWKSESISANDLALNPYIIGTGSIRRKSQWLSKFPNHSIENLRGNVQTRLTKLSQSNWIGAVFAAAGLERLDMNTLNVMPLDWMIPAPAQGAIMIACRENDSTTYDWTHQLNDILTEQCVHAERQLLSDLHGGCSAPIGAYMYKENDQWRFKACVTSLDGTVHYALDEIVDQYDEYIGSTMAQKLKEMGAEKLIEDIRG